jgi:hypothetical protein
MKITEAAGRCSRNSLNKMAWRRKGCYRRESEMATDEDGYSSVDPAKLRRFAIGVALVMWVYVFASGLIGNKITIQTLDITLSRPSVILLLVLIVSAYASVRYWLYGIKIPIVSLKEAPKRMPHTLSDTIQELADRLRTKEGKDRSEEYKTIITLADYMHELAKKVEKIEAEK